MKTFNLFISGSDGVGKLHLIISFYQSVTKLLQYYGGSPEKPPVLILALMLNSSDFSIRFTVSWKAFPLSQ